MQLPSTANQEAILSDVLKHTSASLGRYRIYTEIPFSPGDNLTWRVDYLSPGCEVLYGYTAAEFTENPSLWRSRVYPVDWQTIILPNFELAHTVTAAEPCKIQTEYRIYHKDGSLRWISEHLTFHCDEGDESCTITGIATDITQRKQTELALQQSEAKNRALLNTIPDLMFRVNRQGEYLEYFTRHREFDIIPSSIDPTGRRSSDFLPPAVVTKKLQVIQRAIDTQTLQVYEQHFQTDDRLHVEEVRIAPFGTQEALCMIRDISERAQLEADRKRAEQQLQQLNADLEARVEERTAELQDSEERFRRIYEQSPLGMSISNLAGTLIRVNQQLCHLTGYTEAQLLGRCHLDLVYPDDRPVARELAQRMAEGLEAQGTVEKRYVTRTGETIWVQVTHAMIDDRQGRPTSILSMVQDITARKRLELALTDSEAKLRNVLDGAISTAIVSYRVFANGRWICDFQSRGCETLFGYTVTEFLADSQLWFSRVLPEDLDTMLATVIPGILAEQSTTAEYRFRHKDGSIRWISATFTSRRDPSQPYWNVIGVSTDISQRMRLEFERRCADSALRQALQELNYLVENSPLATIRWDRHLQVEHWSKQAEAIFGWQAEAIVGKTIHDWNFIVEADFEQVSRCIEKLLAGENCVVNSRNYHQSGSVLYCEWYNSVLLDESGNLIAILSLVQDVTQRRTTELALQESEARYRAIVEDQTELIARFLPDNTIRFVNDAYCRYFGIDRSTVIGKNHTSAIYAADREHVIQQIQSLNFEHPTVLVENRVVVNGETRWTQWSNRMVFDEQGQFIEYQSVGRDITDAKHVERDLRQSQQKYQNLLDSIDAIVWEADPQFQYTFVSQQAERILGYPLSQWQEHDFWVNHLHPDDRSRMIDFCTHHIQQQQDHISEYRMIAANGQVVWIHDTTNVVVEQGQTQRIQGVLINISDRKASELAFQDSETRYRRIVETAGEGIWMIDANQRTTFVNDHMAQMLGTTVHDMIGKTLFDFMDEEGCQLARTYVERRRQGIAEQHDFKFCRRDGSDLWVIIATTPILDTNDDYLGALAMLTDITERKQIETQLRILSDRLSLAIKSGAIGIWDWDILNQRLVWDDRMCELYGISPTEFDGTIEMLINAIHPDDRANTLATGHRALEEDIDYDTEFRAMHPDGSIRFIKAYGLVQRSTTGKPQRMIGINLDVTDRRQVETELRQNQAALAAAQKVAHVGSWEYDVATQSQQWSEEMFHIFGLSPKQPAPTYGEMLQLIHPGDRTWVMAQNTIEQCLQAESFQPFEHRLIRPDGTIRHVEVRGKPIFNNQQQIIKLFGTVLDITDRKQAEAKVQQANETLAIANAELARANRLKDEFLANMSHELRTPLNAILGLSGVLKSEAFGKLTTQQQQFVDTIFSSGNHLLSLINDILDLAKIESGKFELELAPTDITTLCEISLTFVRQQAQQKNIALEIHLPPTPLIFQADERRLRQVLINLLSNGVKFTPEGGQVTLKATVTPANDALCLQVIDTGIGIAATDLDRLFQPFVQIDSSLARHYEGTGLGLALVKQIVDMHYGHISVTSELGRGSCFTVTLPATWASP